MDQIIVHTISIAKGYYIIKPNKSVLHFRLMILLGTLRRHNKLTGLIEECNSPKFLQNLNIQKLELYESILHSFKRTTYLSAFLLHLFKVTSYTLWDSWFCDTNANYFNSWSITCAITLESIFHLFINLATLSVLLVSIDLASRNIWTIKWELCTK